MGRTSKSVVWALAAIGGVACLTACGGGKSAPRATPTVPPSSIPEGVLTYHNDLGRTGQNLDETILTPTNVNQATFGRKFADLVDGQVYAQPLYVANLSIQGGTHNVAFVATENDTVYAFDADQPGLPLWQASVLGTGSPVLATDVGCSQISPQIGITSTPVIDLTSRTLYAVAMTKEGPSASPTFFQRLHALDITTGAEKFGGPVAIAATVPGTGAGGSGTSITFDPRQHLNRPGLALFHGTIYIAFGSHCDSDPYHGWLFAYNAAQLTPAGVFITTPNGTRGAIWQGGGSIAVDASNSLYFMTGNGTFDTNQDFGDSFVKLTQSGTTLTLADSFTPFNQSTLAANDADLGSGAPMVLPDQSGAHPHLLIGAGKGGTIYLLNRDAMGGFCNGCTSDTQIVQELPNAVGNATNNEFFGTPAFLNGFVYFVGNNDVPKAFSLTNGLLSTSPASQGVTVFGFPGATPSVSANGASNGIVWIVQNAASSGGPAILRAYDATNLARELYNSTQAGTRDQADPAVKFAVPTIFNGKVYFGTANHLDVYGPLP